MTTAESLAPAPDPRSARAARRQELAGFLRSRRARLRPEDVDLLPGPRRRTPGLRREEVALLAGVGVTWYTWLEQGRPIRASAQVLDAVAAALRLDPAERDHLFRLADTPRASDAGTADPCSVPLREILDSLEPLPAALLNSRFDVLRANAAWDAVFHGWRCDSSPAPRNVLWCAFTEPRVRERFLNFEEEASRHVAMLRAAYAHHLGEPAWEEFVGRLTAASPDFARMWARHDVASPGARIKEFRDASVGVLRLVNTTLTVPELPESRIVVYSPSDDQTRVRLHQLLGRA